ncbi:MAG: threonine--tRNA ligase [Planctomycetaceae bacterium]|jgi:threonyl-tRNA synthetase|nr:threonine--tRNA ligase [Planctomycetaceae bacterium]
MIKVVLPDGSEKEFTQCVTVYDVAANIGTGLARAAVAAVVDGQTVGANFKLPENSCVQLRILTKKDTESLDILRHSTAHLMARAVMRLYGNADKNVQLAFGPTVENGFYYDFWMDHHLTEEDFPKIEDEMKKLIKLDEVFERIEYSHNEAIEILNGIGQTLKVEHLNDTLANEQIVSFYRQGEFLDLCRGPHIPSPKFIGAFKLTSVAGAYWKGDASKQQLQRLYGTAFFDKKELDEHLTRIEEAKKRDHRVLGKQHELFAIDSRVGQGLILWLPKGAVVRRQLENFIMEELIKRGYTTVNTPVIGNIELYKTSGHYPYYADSQFPPIKMQDGDEFLLRPMNCPHHVMIYSQKPRSYRDLPVRIAEFGCVHRFEQSGELNGMTRVRGFTQDDAHIFCTPEQVEEEFRSCIDMTLTVLKTMGFNDFEVRLSFRDWVSDKYVGKPENWKIAQASLEKVCREMQLPSLEIVEGEAAFYGPKADFVVRDCLGRKWQLGTVQLDYNLPSPERFNLEYTGSDNKPHTPIMIHRAPLGSFERFCGILIEHFGAAFPLWLSPEQLRILTVSEKFNDYAKSIEQKFLDHNIRVTTDLRNEKIGAKIREGRLDLIPYLAVVGAKESESNTVALRSRKDGELGEIGVDTVIEKLVDEIKIRKL